MEAAEIEHASFKFQFQQKRVAYIEMNTKQLAVFELHILKGRATKVYQTQIALIELAVGKAVVAQSWSWQTGSAETRIARIRPWAKEQCGSLPQQIRYRQCSLMPQFREFAGG
jgi:flagellar biosynthesis component FlhA